ncbi:hypothetical protein E3N88_37519 [Mikania micrantha]|uniref:Uncharacterized protein n=1 Tax=Mikania micrantha TaxID=192012 RepID=A0A5N6LTP3_9ASTR|nr:hypothetical protein E3N88_37519 [Mikania micrantha]
MIEEICDLLAGRLTFDFSIFKATWETSANTHLIGMETRMQELKSLLEVGSGNVCMVEIYGMWGSVLHGSVGSRFVLGFNPENEEAQCMFLVWKKTVYVDRLLQLFKYVPREQLTIPDFVF